MPFTPIPAGLSSAEALRHAAYMLSEWEQARPVNSAAVTPGLRTAFAQLVGEVLSGANETNLYLADVQEVLRKATGLIVGRGEASGPGRAHQALQKAYRNTQAVGPQIATSGLILLLVQSRPGAEPQMDELTNISETLWQNAGPEWEMVFGHGTVPGLPTEIRLTFVLAPSCSQQ